MREQPECRASLFPFQQDSCSNSGARKPFATSRFR
jgi:hypothetical protein